MKSVLRKIYYLSLRLAKKWWHAPFLIISLPVALVLTIIFPFYKVRFIRLCSDRIGHYAMNTELFLCYLDEIKEKRTKYFFYTLDAPICNSQLHTMWKRIILIIPFPKIVPQINACLRHIFGNRYKNDILKKIESGSGNQDIHGYFKKYQPHLSFTISEKKQGIKFLSDLGIPDGSPYVCLFVRDSAYLSKYFPDRDWSYHNYRDCDIDNFRKAALFLADLGYYVIRMGKVVLKSLDVNHEKVIDYANCSIRSDFGDIYLTAHCDFFISTPSGLDGVAQIFRRPILLVNMPIFVPGCLDYWYPSKLFITKKFFDRTRNKFISLKELDNVLLNTVNFQKTSEDLNWIPIENDEDEILEAVREMVNSFEKKNEEDSLSNPLHGLLKTQLPFLMMSGRSLLREYPEKCHVRICSQFLKNNYHLISE